MMEFFISKFWALLSGIAVFSVVAASINGAVHFASDQYRAEALDQLVGNIAAAEKGQQAHMEIMLVDFLIEDEILIVYNGSMELVGDGYRQLHDLPSSIVVLNMDKIELVGGAHLTLSLGSVLNLDMVDRNGIKRIEIYEAKTLTSLSTDSTNLLTSSMLL